MRKFYEKHGSQTQAGSWLKSSGKVLGLAALMGVVGFSANAATAMKWVGGTNNSFTLDGNWDPQGSIVSNNLTIPLRADYTNTPIMTGSTSVSVGGLEIASSGDTTLCGQLVVNLDSDDISLTVGTGMGTIDYGAAGVTVKRGSLYYNNSMRYDFTGAFVRVEGGYVQYKNSIIMGNADAATDGGTMYISGGKVKINNASPFGRIYSAKSGVVLTGSGILQVTGNWNCQSLIDNNWITGGTDYKILRSYDAVANVTTLTAVAQDQFVVMDTTRQVLKVGASATALKLLETTKVSTATSLTWKYRKVGETTYTDFSPVASGVSYAPVFTEAGTFFVVCEGVDGSGITKSKETEFYVGSEKISLTPYSSLQYCRYGIELAAITASCTSANFTNLQWKVSTTPGTGYENIEGATSAVFSPVFDATGIYYVALFATVDGVATQALEMKYIVETVSTVGKSITWTGAYSSDVSYPYNYSPVAPMFRNTLNFPASTPVALLSGEVNDTIQMMNIPAGGKLTINKGEKSILNIRSTNYIEGELVVESGNIVHSTGYLHLDAESTKVYVKNNATFRSNQLFLSNNKTAGGHLYLSENAKFFCDVNQPARFCADTLESQIHMAGNAKMYFIKDYRTTVNDYIKHAKRPRIICDDANYVPYAFYDPTIDSTIVRVNVKNSFALKNDSLIFTTAEIPSPRSLDLINVDGVEGFAWYYSTRPSGGEWIKFEGSDNTVPFTPTFNQTGKFFIIAKSSAGVETSNVAPVEVVQVTTTPSGESEVLVNGTLSLSYSLPAGLTIKEGYGWYQITEANPDGALVSALNAATFAVPTSATGKQTYYFMCEVADSYGNPFTLYSKDVVISVVTELTPNAIVSNKAEKLDLYPNPSTGTFYVNGGSDEYSVEVIDMKGSVVFKQAYAGGEQAVSLSSKGIFTVKVVSDSKLKVGRVIIK